MLFAGILYSWSILKAPLADAFGWNASQLTMNFTLTMCFFCLGGVGGGLLARRLGTRLTIALGGALACIGFVLTARLDGSSLPMLYLSYGVITATGIGFAYNVVLSTVQAWFPDKKGTCSGALLMGFGASSLVLGSLADALIQNPAVGWRAAFLCLGVAIGIVLVAAALLIRLPAPGTVLPQPKAAANRVQEDFEAADYTTGQMLRRFTFWRAFLCIIFLAAMGNTVISFAKDLSLSVGASAALSTTLVGVLAVCNGLGRILTGALFDTLGRRRTMLLANGAAILAALVTLLSVAVHSVPLCVAGLCITGISYGACPTISSAFTSSFYGAKYFSLNFSVMNFNLTGASFIATAASVLLTQTRWCCCWCSPWPPWHSTSASSVPEPPQADKKPSAERRRAFLWFSSCCLPSCAGYTCRRARYPCRCSRGRPPRSPRWWPAWGRVPGYRRAASPGWGG